MSESNQTSVKFVPALCPKCGGQLEVDPTQEAAVCQYCGSAFVVEKAINNYTVQNATIEHVDHVTIEQKSHLQSVLDFAGDQLKSIREDSREKRKIEEESKKEFLKNAWKIIAIMFAAMILLFVLGNVFGFFN